MNIKNLIERVWVHGQTLRPSEYDELRRQTDALDYVLESDDQIAIRMALNLAGLLPDYKRAGCPNFNDFKTWWRGQNV